MQVGWKYSDNIEAPKKAPGTSKLVNGWDNLSKLILGNLFAIEIETEL